MKTNKINNFLKNNVAWVILFLICVIFTIMNSRFLTLRNIRTVLDQNAYLIVASCGIVLIQMSGNLDISIGYQMSIIGVVCATLMTTTGMPILLVILIGILLGMAMSAFNCWLAKRLQLSWLIVSLATQNIFLGISFLYSNSRTINDFPASFKFLGQGYLGPVPFAIVIAAVSFIIMDFVLSKTYFGRYIYALGGNEEATRLAGINVSKMKYSISLISGAFVGLSALMLISRMSSAQSGIGPGTEFTVITAIFLGGVSIRGGEGKLSSVLAGVLLLGVLTNGMQLSGIDTYWQSICKGILMIAAIAFDVYQLGRRQKVKREEIAMMEKNKEDKIKA